MPNEARRNPWSFVPALYFMQGVPVVIVQQVSVTLLKKMGMDNAQIGLWTSLIAWPWIVKMLWGPLVDNVATKRRWILLTQPMIAVALLLSAVAMLSPAYLPILLGLFFVIAFLSATHDIAADGFYLLALKEDAQAFFVGIRSASFRLAMIFGTAALVAIAGQLEGSLTIAQTWAIALGVGGVVYAGLYMYGVWALPKPPTDTYRSEATSTDVATRFGQVLLLFVGLFLGGRLIALSAATVNHVLIQFLNAPQVTKPLDTLPALFMSTATIHPGIQLAGNIGALGLIFLSTKDLFRKIGMAATVRDYVAQPKIAVVLAFILFYRFGESMIGKMAVPFLLDPAEKGGLGLTTTQSGQISGTIGVIALTVGGLMGGWAISKFGIKRCLWPMVLALNVPNLFYVWAAFSRPGIGAVGGLVAVDQFGYGFGFSAYMVYLMYLSRGAKNATSHYAISTGLMALGAMLAGIASGYLQTAFATIQAATGYAWFFVAVCACTIPGMLTLPFLPLREDDLKVAPVDLD